MHRNKRVLAVLVSSVIAITGSAVSAASAQAQTERPGNSQRVDIDLDTTEVRTTASNKTVIPRIRVTASSGDVVNGRDATANPWRPGTKPTVQVRMKVRGCGFNAPTAKTFKLPKASYRAKSIMSLNYGSMGFLDNVTFTIPDKYMHGFLWGKYVAFETAVITQPKGSPKRIRSDWVEFSTSNDCDRP